MFRPRDDSDWRNLIQQGRRIPNNADRCHVLSTLYGLMTGKVSMANESLLVEIEGLINNLSLQVETIEHYMHLTHCIRKVNKSKSKDYIRESNGCFTAK